MFKKKQDPVTAPPKRGFDHVFEPGTFGKRGDTVGRPHAKGPTCRVCGCLPDECKGERR